MATIGLTDLTQKRIRKFTSIRRGFFSLIIITVLYVVSFGLELLANNTAILVRYNGKYFFPVFQGYIPESKFGGPTAAEPEYRELQQRLKEEGNGNFVLMPIIPYGPTESLLDLPGYPPNKPSWQHPLGTDDRGRDVLVRLFYGFRISMTFGLQVTSFSMLLGICIGALQGYYGGKFDITVQRFIEIWSTLPRLYILIIIISIYEPGYSWLVLLLTIFGWMGMTYYIRGEFYREKSKEYVLAAKALGARDVTIIFRHILPNSLVPVITIIPFSLVGSIFALTSLDFLGFGLPAPTPSWGELMGQGLGNIFSYWLSLSPISALFITLLLLTFIGEAVREAFDPKQLNSLVNT